MQVSRSPTARWTSAAATAESTPPDSAQMTSPSDRSRPRARRPARGSRRRSGSMKLAGVQVGAAPAMPDDEVAQDVPARAACGRPRGGTGSRRGCAPGPASPANGDESVWAVEREALRQAGDRVAVAHPDRLVAIEAAEQAVAVGDRDGRRPVLALRGRRARRRRARGPSAGRRSRCRGPGSGRDQIAGVGLRRVRRRRRSSGRPRG